MTPRFGWLANLFARRFFAGFRFPSADAERLRELGERGSVVYVMRYSSRLDYFLFNWLFIAAGLELSAFANGIRFFYYRPLSEAVPLLFQGIRERMRLGRRGRRNTELVALRRLVRDGGKAFLFLRSDKMGSRLDPKPERDRIAEIARAEREFMQVIRRTAAGRGAISSLAVPLEALRAARESAASAVDRPRSVGDVLRELRGDDQDRVSHALRVLLERIIVTADDMELVTRF